MANYIEWLDSYSVGVEALDEDHKTLIGLANQVMMIMHEGGDEASLARVLDELVEYTVAHFGKEEELMRLTGYPGYQQHREAHDRLTRQVFRHTHQARHNRVKSVELAEFLIDWLMEHIRDEDAAYSSHFHQHGIH